jgi:predicted transcriptional regulator
MSVPKPKPKRPVAKMFVVSDDTHRRLKEYAQKKGYKLQYVADEAVNEYLEGKETK